ncbi:MAG: agmatinase family protein [Myxococcota bacterium]
MTHEIYDAPCDPMTARFQILPVPFDATTSYRSGTANGPAAIFAASVQVDLRDVDVGSPYLAGIHMAPIPEDVLKRNAQATASKDPEVVNKLTAQNNAFTYEWSKGILAKGQTPVILGGDHSVPLGNIRACAEHHESIGILHIDAHADLRQGYNDFADSHASIMYNVVTQVPQVARLIQVGVRDYCDEEADLIDGSSGRVQTFFDPDLRRARMSGKLMPFFENIISHLPQKVYLSVDIDGLDPTLCPSTGTPVPGGLRFDEFVTLLEILASSGKTIIGLDLVEVAVPSDLAKDSWGECWDANVGARVLYKMIGFALKTYT